MQGSQKQWHNAHHRVRRAVASVPSQGEDEGARGRRRIVVVGRKKGGWGRDLVVVACGRWVGEVSG